MLRWNITLFLLVSWSLSIYGNTSSCGLTDLIGSKRNFDNYWDHSKVANVKVDGEVYPLSYSFDAEVSHADLLRLILEKDEWKEELETLLKEIPIGQRAGLGGFVDRLRGIDRQSAFSDLTSIHIDELVKIDGRSKKQFLAFGGLRKGVDKDREYYSITEVNDLLYDDILNIVTKSYAQESKIRDNIPDVFVVSKTQADKFFARYKELVRRVLVEDKKLPVRITNDQNFIELPHESFELGPKAFSDLIFDRIKTLFKWDSTHLHIGIPNKIGTEASQAIARAVEARIIVEHAMNSRNPRNTLYATSYSSLRGPIKSSKKSAGVIRFNFDRHTSPVRMNDLEVRNYLRTSEGMRHIALAGLLSRSHKTLHLIDNFSADKIDDPYTSNLNGALKYLGALFIRHNSEDMVELGKRMTEFAERIEAQGTIDQDIRSDVFSFLRSNNILDKLTPEVFLTN